VTAAGASIRLWGRALPAMLRVGVAEALAYRAEFLVWMLTTTLPLVMLGLWTTVASEGPFAGYGTADFTAYYLTTLIVRNLTGSWVVWQMNGEIRDGTLSMRLLRPIHPFISYAAVHLAAVPLRAAIMLPVAIVLLATSGAGSVTRDPLHVALFVVSVVGAWLITFFVMTLLGALGFFIQKSIAVFEVYLGIYALFSGYLLPLALLPGWVGEVARWLPFRYMLGFPVEILIGAHDTVAVLRGLAVRWAFAAAAITGAVLVWRAGVRRYEAYGS
jgi:ABC-2 type transport system permease protein